ncbi:hypothetical protein Pan189_42360 [Stratiformator vulcanicus]|uniref:Uncharacterized protein n=1 Tax=Stratiformator vulcanicus TaxID=2527980 RepID=A0A517R7G0_9PLAN|nr:hypothetical protein Pan189_42360 [Stratiformator vulcanicus]
MAPCDNPANALEHVRSDASSPQDFTPSRGSIHQDSTRGCEMPHTCGEILSDSFRPARAEAERLCQIHSPTKSIMIAPAAH